MFTPVDNIPVIIALFIIREVLCASLLVETKAPFLKEAPYAAPSFAANSGDISIFAMPVTPYGPKIFLLHFSPQIRMDARIAPSSTLLYGQTFTPALTVLPLPMRQLSLITAPSARYAPSFISDLLATTFSCSTAFCPIETLFHRIEEMMVAPFSMIQLSPTIESIILASAPTLQFAPMTTEPSTLQVKSTLAPFPNHTPLLLTSSPGIFTFTLPWSISRFALRYSSRLPTSLQ